MTRFDSHASAEFWKRYWDLPPEVQEAADRKFALFQNDPFYPSLHLKQVGDLWSVRITESCRALAVREGNTFYWFFVGSHNEYERIISG